MSCNLNFQIPNDFLNYINKDKIISAKQALEKQKPVVKISNAESRMEKDFVYNIISDILKNSGIVSGKYVGLMGVDVHHISASLWPYISEFHSFEMSDIYNSINNFAAVVQETQGINLKVTNDNIFNSLVSNVDVFDFDFNTQLDLMTVVKIGNMLKDFANDLCILSVWSSIGFRTPEVVYNEFVSKMEGGLSESFNILSKKTGGYSSTMPMRYGVYKLERKGVC